MLWALLRQWEVYSSSKERIGQSVILWAVPLECSSVYYYSLLLRHNQFWVRWFFLKSLKESLSAVPS